MYTVQYNIVESMQASHYKFFLISPHIYMAWSRAHTLSTQLPEVGITDEGTLAPVIFFSPPGRAEAAGGPRAPGRVQRAFLQQEITYHIRIIIIQPWQPDTVMASTTASWGGPLNGVTIVTVP